MRVESWLADHRSDLEADLFGLLEIESVSRDPSRKGEMARCAERVAELLRGAGLEEVQVLGTAGHPAVLGRRDHLPGKPTVLVYGHYDVQPADPAEGWSAPPFVPTVREGRVYARGASDDKGQLLAHLQAARAFFETEGGAPVNLVFLVEGEEEVGSRHLPALLEAHAGQIRADVVVVSDGPMFAPGVPGLVYALRGLVALEVVLRGPGAGFALARLVAGLLGPRREVAVPGFYDRVLSLDPEERSALAALGGEDEELRARLGVRGLSGEEGYTARERRWARPTLDVNGMLSGPAWAMAKLTCRLVPEQGPEEVADLLRHHVLAACPPGLAPQVTARAGGKPWLTPRDHPALQAAARALEAVFGRPPVFQREGGSIPAVIHLRERLGAPAVLMGLGLDSDGAHGPDEHFSLEGYHQGIRASVELLRRLSALSPEALRGCQQERGSAPGKAPAPSREAPGGSEEAR